LGDQLPRELLLSGTCVDTKDSPTLPAHSPYFLTIAFTQEYDDYWVQCLIKSLNPFQFFPIQLAFTNASYVLSILPCASCMYHDIRRTSSMFPKQLGNILKEMIENEDEYVNKTLETILSFYNNYRILDMWKNFWLYQVKYAVYAQDISNLPEIYWCQRGILLNQAENLHTHLMWVMSRHKQNKNPTPLPTPLIRSIDKEGQNTEPKQRWADLSETESQKSLKLPSTDTANTPKLRRRDRGRQEIRASEQNTKPRQRTDLLKPEQGPEKSKKPLGKRAYGPNQNPLPTNGSLPGNRTSR
jgi:hypothetical protein